MAERLMIEITDRKIMGRQEAHEFVRGLSQEAFRENRHLKEVFAESEIGGKFRRSEIEGLFDYSTYTGESEKVVERALRD